MTYGLHDHVRFDDPYTLPLSVIEEYFLYTLFIMMLEYSGWSLVYSFISTSRSSGSKTHSLLLDGNRESFFVIVSITDPLILDLWILLRSKEAKSSLNSSGKLYQPLPEETVVIVEVQVHNYSLIACQGFRYTFRMKNTRTLVLGHSPK